MDDYLITCDYILINYHKESGANYRGKFEKIVQNKLQGFARIYVSYKGNQFRKEGSLNE
jgi:hypothetical protein